MNDAMTRFSILALAFAAMAAVTVSAHAQDRIEAIAGTPPEQRAKLQTDMMKEKLALTAEQLPKVESINLDTAKKMQPVLESKQGPLMRMSQARTIEQAKDKALESVLTPSQYQNWLAAKDEMKQKLEQKLVEGKKAGGGM